jgi:hypothetical protein
MGAGAKAIRNAKILQNDIVELGLAMGLDVAFNVPMGRTIWDTDRKIDVVFSQTVGGGMVAKRLGIECIFQDGPGTAKYKVLAKMEDTKRWPIEGIVVFDGPGFGKSVEAVMSFAGAVRFSDLAQWVKFYFDLPGIGGKTPK